MKTTLTHLPEVKQQELAAVTEIIKNTVHPEMIILFGSYSRGSWVEDRYVENGTIYEYKSDYDILIVMESEETESPGIAKRLKKAIDKSGESETRVSPIFHSISYLNKELERDSYFFRDIVAEGILLYNSGRHKLAAPKPVTPAERARKAKLYFDNWFGSGNEFYGYYETGYQKGQYKTAIFMLHQATEHFFMAILLVFTDSKPKIHDLEELYKLVIKADLRFIPAIPRRTKEEEELFQFLRQAYIRSRYEMGYKVELQQLEYLASRVQVLKELTEKICTEKINSYAIADS